MTAVNEEFKAIRSLLPSVEIESTDGFSFVTGKCGDKTIVLAKSGMGAERAFRCARTLIYKYNPSSMLITGFAGAIRAGIVPGDIIIGTGIVPLQSSLVAGQTRTRAIFSSHGDGRLSISSPNPQMLHQAINLKGNSFTVHKGMLLAVSNIIEKSEQKKRLAGTGAKAVDMESLAASTICDAEQVPWLAIRAITDGCIDSMPISFEKFVDNRTGEVSVAKLAKHAMCHPRLIRPMVELGQRSKLAGRNLASFVKEYLK